MQSETGKTKMELRPSLPSSDEGAHPLAGKEIPDDGSIGPKITWRASRVCWMEDVVSAPNSARDDSQHDGG